MPWNGPWKYITSESIWARNPKRKRSTHQLGQRGYEILQICRIRITQYHAHGPSGFLTKRQCLNGTSWVLHQHKMYLYNSFPTRKCSDQQCGSKSRPTQRRILDSCFPKTDEPLQRKTKMGQACSIMLKRSTVIAGLKSAITVHIVSSN